MDTAILPAPPPIGQRLLFSQEIEELVSEAEEREGRYTAERFKVRRPMAYQAAVELLGAGIGLLKIGRWLGAHHLTIAAVRDGPDSEAIDIASQTLGKLDTAIQLQLDRLLEHPGLVPMTHVGQLLDLLVRNRELLAGRATSREEKYERIDVFATWEETVQAFVSEKELPAESVREIGPAIGFEPGKNLPIGDAGQAAAVDLVVDRGDHPPVGAGAARADEQSDTSPRADDGNLTSNLANAGTDQAELEAELELAIGPAGAADPGSKGRGGDAPQRAGGDLPYPTRSSQILSQ